MRNFSRDILFEVRQLSKTPVFTATAALTLSLAIGSATAIYSVVEGVLLRPLPFADPQNLVELSDMIDGNGSEDPSLPANESILLTRNTRSFLSLGAFQWLAYELSGPIPAARISEPIFDGGRIRSNYRLSKAQEQEMLLDYQKTVLNSLKDVSNALVSYKETREHREEQAEQVKSAADAVRLARLRHSGGNTS